MRVMRRYSPLLELNDFANELLGANSQRNISGFTPAVNTREDEKSYYIEVDLPGVKKEDLNVDFDKNHISISGERKYKNETKEEDYYKSESFFGKFSRSFSLPDSVDADAISAKFEDGVLNITIPKVAPKIAKKIEVQ